MLSATASRKLVAAVLVASISEVGAVIIQHLASSSLFLVPPALPIPLCCIFALLKGSCAHALGFRVCAICGGRAQEHARAVIALRQYAAQRGLGPPSGMSDYACDLVGAYRHGFLAILRELLSRSIPHAKNRAPSSPVVQERKH